MAPGSHGEEVGRRVLAESIALQQTVAAGLETTPLPPLPRRGTPVVLQVTALMLVVMVLGICGWLVV